MKTVVLFITIVAVSFHLSIAQIDIQGKVKEKAKQRAESRTDRAIDNVFDRTEEEIDETLKKKPKNNDQNTSDENSDEVEEKNEPKTAASQNVKDIEPSLKTYSNFDFVPGSKVLFFDDFSTGSIGDFPSMWNSNASGEIIRTNIHTGNWFMMNTDGFFYLNEGLQVGENFTIEFDVFLSLDELHGCQFNITLFEPSDEGLFPGMFVPGKHGIEINLGSIDLKTDIISQGHDFRTYNSIENIQGMNGSYTKQEGFIHINKPTKISIWVQKTRLRLYVNNTKVFDLQRAFPNGAKVGQIRFGTWDVCKANITNFRVADAGEDNRSKLLTEGKIVSYGIYFDSGKDIVKPESYGSIKEIATILKDNPNVKIMIVGHTDSDGNANSNLDLSKRRAANVKKVLISEFGIAADRIETDGKGQNEPVAPNTSLENKAKNRRVEFIKL